MWNSLRVRLTAILLGLAIGPLLLAGVILYQRTFASEQNLALAFQSQVAQNVAAEVDSLFQNIVNDLTTLGGSIQSLTSPDRAQQLSVLLGALGSGTYQDAYEELTLLDSQGREVVRLSRQKIVSASELASHQGKDEFEQPKSNREPYYSPVQFDAQSGQAFMLVAIPLYEPRSVQLKNVLIAKLRFGIVANLLGRSTFGEDQTIYMTDNNGNLITHENRSIKFQDARITLPAKADFQRGLDGTNVVLSFQEIQLGLQTFKIVAEKPASQALTLANTTITTLGFVIIVSLVIAIILGFLAIQQIVQPIEKLAVASQSVASGDLTQQVPIFRKDEIGVLASAFNSMTSQLQNLIGTLENRVNERTLDLEKARALSERRAQQFEAITQVSSAITTAQNVQELLPRVSEVISNRFGFYHVGIFLCDASNQYAVLSAANSPGGKIMLERNHRLKIGEQGIVGYVTETGTPRIALDVGKDATHFINPDLPETHSEMALPLKIAGSIIGALDVQSTQPNAFSSDDVEILSTLANQVSLAIQNTRLFEQTQKSLSEAEAMSRQYLRESWSRVPTEQKLSGYKYTVIGTIPLQEIKPSESADQRKNKQSDPRNISVPIVLRGETIGTLEVQIPNQEHIKADQMDLIKAVAERVALSAENARLFEDTTRRAERERLVSDITTKIRGSNNPEEMIRIAAQEIKNALGVSRVDVLPQKLSNEPKP
jgi:GAF domain-containing protein/HAMP domain-containing protein